MSMRLIRINSLFPYSEKYRHSWKLGVPSLEYSNVPSMASEAVDYNYGF